jgi:nucleotide-binding universal stress UspA family protein
MMGTIVCAIDDSAEAAEALRVAARLSDDIGLRLVVAHVEDSVGSGSDVLRSAQQRGDQMLDRILGAEGLSGGSDRRVEVGVRSSELARVAAEEAANLIVVGSCSHRWWQGRRTSKLTGELATTAECPVVVVPARARR